MSAEGFVIVGGGPAGLAAARAYRDRGGTGSVWLIGDEGRSPYNRPPLTKELLRGEVGEETLALEDDSFYESQRIALVHGRVDAVDPQRRAVTLAGGRELAYDTLLLATGAEPTRLPVDGVDHPAVAVVRTLNDVRELLGRLRIGVPVAVIGSGFIGCEIAASLRHRGHPVTVISQEPAPNLARLGEAPAARIAEWLRADGVALVAGSAAEAIEHGDGRHAVQTASGPVAAEVIVLAAGVAPRSELARRAGLALGEAGAILTDAGMRTSDPRILAGGDVAEARNVAAGRRLRVEHWGDALGQGEIAGKTAAGAEAQWDVVPGFWSTIGTRTLKYAAWGDGFDETEMIEHEDRAFTAVYGREGLLAGVLAHDRDEAYERGKAMIAAGTPYAQACAELGAA